LGMGVSCHWANHAVEALLGELQETSNPVEERVAAAQSLVLLAGNAKSAIPTMLEMMGDDDGEIRQLAVTFLVRMGRQIKQPLQQQLTSSDDKRFAAAALALSQFASVSLKADAGRLEKLSHHEDATIRSMVTSAMGQVMSQRTRDRLCKLLSDREPAVRLAAVNALGTSTQANHLLTVLSPAMKDDNPHVRQTVVRIISQQTDGKTEKAIQGMMHQERDQDAKKMMQRALERISWQRTAQSH
jgi:HEAT repeat protein